MISDKVPGSYNPPSPLENKDFNGFVATTSPTMDYRLGNAQPVTSPVVNEVDKTMNTHPLPIGGGVDGVINTEKSVNVPSTSTGRVSSFDFGVR